MAGIEFSALSRDLPHRIGDTDTLVRHVNAWQRRRDAARTEAGRQFTAADARIKLRRLSDNR